MTDEIVLLSLPKIELKALIIDCLATVLEDYQPAPAAAPQNAVFDVEGLTQYAGLSKDTIYRKAGRGKSLTASKAASCILKNLKSTPG